MRTWGLGGVCTYTTSDPVLHERWDILNSFLVIHLKTALEDGGMRRLFFPRGQFSGEGGGSTCRTQPTTVCEGEKGSGKASKHRED